MPNAELLAHVKAELTRGTDKETLKQSLLAVGWQDAEIQAAIEIAVPSNVPKPPRPPVPAAPAPVVYGNKATMKSAIQNWAASLFIVGIVLLTFISIMGVWEVFGDEAVEKSMLTLGLLTFVSIIVIVASRFVGDPEERQPAPNPLFKSIRNATLGSLIGSSAVLALLGVLAIWEVVPQDEVIVKTLVTLGVVAFASLITVLVCLEREGKFSKRKGSFWVFGSWGGILGTILVFWLLANLLDNLF